jgi:CPA2 family monovalent cation:H+ antiporter-2
MHEIPVITTIALGLSAALLFGLVVKRIGLSPIVGYLIAGVVVGPSTPGFIADAHIAEQFAEIGVILLMFGVGLQFHLDELLAVRRIAIPGAIAQSAVATVLGALAAHAFGWAWLAAIVFGLSLSVTSTVVLVRVLSDCRRLHTEAGHIAVGWLVVQDVLAVLVLVLLPAMKSGSTPTALAMSMAVALRSWPSSASARFPRYSIALPGPNRASCSR